MNAMNEKPVSGGEWNGENANDEEISQKKEIGCHLEYKKWFI